MEHDANNHFGDGTLHISRSCHGDTLEAGCQEYSVLMAPVASRYKKYDTITISIGAAQDESDIWFFYIWLPMK